MKSIWFTWWCAAACVCAQESPTASLRLLALGELPPFRQEIRDGVRRELDPPEGSVPPRILEAGLPSSAEEDAKAPVFPLQLSTASPPAKVFPVDGKVELREPGQGGWAQVSCPPGTRTLAVLWRPGDSWRKPKVLSLPDLAPDHDPRVFRFVNVATQTVGVVFGETRYQLATGKTLSLTVPDGARAVSVSVLFADAGGVLKPCFSTIAEPRNGSATQYFVHRADGESPRRPVTVTPVSGPLAMP
jgi:hypothetical protein